jgi:hypothetical protein
MPGGGEKPGGIGKPGGGDVEAGQYNRCIQDKVVKVYPALSRHARSGSGIWENARPRGDGRPGQWKVEAHLGKSLAQEELEWEVLVPGSYK